MRVATTGGPDDGLVHATGFLLRSDGMTQTSASGDDRCVEAVTSEDNIVFRAKLVAQCLECRQVSSVASHGRHDQWSRVTLPSARDACLADAAGYLPLT